MTSADPAERSAVAAAAFLIAPAADPRLTDVCGLAVGLTGAQGAVITVADGGRNEQLAVFGTGPTAPGGAPADDLCVELRTPTGDTVGSLCLVDETTREVSPDQRNALAALARLAVCVLELGGRTRELERAETEASQSQDRLAAFAGQLSHDLKAPITAILGFGELLDEMDVIAHDPTAAAYVARCTSAARRMLATIDDLLAFARVGATLQLRPIAPEEVMPAVLADLGAAAVGAKVSWSGPAVVADATQLRALVHNLMRNSLSYRGERACEVRVVTHARPEGIALQVIDNGPGIPADSRDAVLRPLTRLRKDIPGAGLGLAVCVRVMAAHGGSLVLSDTPGGGTTVTAQFPADRPG